MAPVSHNKITIVGAGLTGPLMAIMLARRGFVVDIFEGGGDLRREGVRGLRSINLTIAERGLAALRKIGLDEEALRLCTPLRARAVHDDSGRVELMPYGVRGGDVLYAISRADLTKLLLDAAEHEPRVNLHFHHRCTDIDKHNAIAVFARGETSAIRTVHSDLLIGADGVNSVVRRRMQRGEFVDHSQHYVPWRYKELTITATATEVGGFDREALHVWPRGELMMFALPNLDGSFNGVIVFPARGAEGPAAPYGGGDLRDVFVRNFADVVPHIPNLAEELRERPAAAFPTLKTSSWFYRDKVVLIGDACHAVVPFYGQGMNAGLEDCVALDECLAAYGSDRASALAAYQERRRCHTDVLAELSIENFAELRDTGRPSIAAKKKIMLAVSRVTRGKILPLSVMVSHTTMPYGECVRRARRQEQIARSLGLSIAVGALVAAANLKDAFVTANRRLQATSRVRT
ncbi:FAD-dependent oxidoreductase [Streptosporangium sp. NPDC000396]|uniref:FAD-dependent oxidoreductase n=1 Tax=Streptosporangium sp. NPDC000396 TaxID=3366185 RepID=UPI0036BA1ADE